MTTSDDDLLEALRDVIDPELGINVVDLGLVYDLKWKEDILHLEMTLTSAACPLTDVIEDQVDSVLSDLGVTSMIDWVWSPPWGMHNITDEGRDQLRALGFTA